MSKLRRLSIDNLNNLRQMYAKDRTLNSTTVNAITNALNRIRKTPELKERVEFLSLNDDWRRDGTILIRNESRVYFNTLEKAPYRSIRSSLDALDFDNEITFVCISDRFRQTLHDFLWYNGLEVRFEQGTSGYFMSKEKALAMTIESIPDDYVIKPLTISHVDEINRECPRDGGDHLDYVRNSIKHKMCIGLFDKNTNELISWVLEMDYCSIGMGVTKSSKQRTGLGSFVCKSLLKKIATDKDMDLTWHVIHGHRVSHKFCHGLGGRVFDTFTWLSAKRKEIKGASKFGLYQLIY